MPSIESIQRKLLEMDPSSFQRLGDEHFTSCSNLKFKEFKPMGLVRGKRIPRKSTPDTLIELNSGKFILVEYTTKDKKENKKAFLKKLRLDLLKCLNSKLTGIAIEDIQTIILATNQLISHTDRNVVTKGIGKIKYLVVEFRDIDYWSFEVRRFSFLGVQFLNLPIETKQVLTISEFVKEYERGGVSTPMSNTFLHRQAELAKALAEIEASGIYILSGAPGVGKTRIALEAASQYIAKHPDCNLYCLKDKGSWSLDDVRTYLLPNCNYLLLVDDANRHLKLLKQLISSLDESSNLKLILTVRDYALSEVKELFNDRASMVDIIKGFPEKELLDIIYQVANFKRGARNRILQLANGNPRLALMAASVVKKTNSLDSVSNASEIFEQYFADLVKSSKVLSASKYLKALGILATFEALELNSVLTNQILQIFDVSRDELLDAVSSLEEMEMAEIEDGLARIPEQNFRIFLFYKAFLKEKKLGLDTLLGEFYPQHVVIIKNAVVAAINAFGYDNIKMIVYHALIGRYKTLKNEKDQLTFLDSFWYYVPTELFIFVNEHINDLPATDNGQDIVNSFYAASPYFRLLTPFLRYNNQNFSPALELLIEFTKKKSSHFKQLCDSIKGNVTYHEESYPAYTCPRKYLTLVVDSWSEHEIYPSLFYDTVNHFLTARFTVATGSYKPNTIALEQHRALLNSSLKRQRKLIWETLRKKFHECPEDSVKVINYYSDHRIDLDNEFITYDSPYIFGIISEHFDSTNLIHCLCVLNFDDLLKKYKTGIALPEKIETTFLKSPTFLTYKVVSWYRDPLRYEIRNENKFSALKSGKIISTLETFTLYEVERLVIQILQWNAQLEHSRAQGLLRSIDLIAEYFLTNRGVPECLMIMTYLANDPGSVNHAPYNTLSAISASSEFHEPFFQFLRQNNFPGSLEWLGLFLENLKSESVTERHINFLLQEITLIQNNFYFDFGWIQSLSSIDATINDRVLSTLINRWRSDKIQIILSRNLFKDAQGKFNGSLLEEAYIMQYQAGHHHFDFSGESFKTLIDANPNFLMTFCKRTLGRKVSTNQDDAYFIKGMVNSPHLRQLASKFLDFLASAKYLSSDDFYTQWNETFNRSNENFEGFVTEYLVKNARIKRRAALVFELADEVFKSEIPFLRIFLRKNNDLEDFKDICLRSNGGLYPGRTNIYERYLSRWVSIKSLFTEFDGIKYLKHRQFVDEMIYNFQASARNEAKKLFMTKTSYDA